MSKSQFCTELHTHLKDGRDDIWVLDEDLIYRSASLDRYVIVPKGFESDLDSIPRWMIFTYATLKGKATREAFIHDYLYRSDSNPIVTRKVADAVFNEAQTAREKPWCDRYRYYVGVRLGGWVGFHSRKVGDKLGS